MYFADTDNCLTLAATGAPPMLMIALAAVAVCILGVALARYRMGSKAGAGALVAGVLVVGLLSVGGVPSAQAADCGAPAPTAAPTSPTESAPAPEPSVAPTESETPAPTTPAPTEPAPTEPAPTEPAPTTPAPTEPAPTEPAPTTPAPTTPAPTTPAPTPTNSPDVSICTPRNFEFFGVVTGTPAGTAVTPPLAPTPMPSPSVSPWETDATEELKWTRDLRDDAWGDDDIDLINAGATDPAYVLSPTAEVTQTWYRVIRVFLNDSSFTDVLVPVSEDSYTADVRTEATDPAHTYRLDKRSTLIPNTSADEAAYRDEAIALAAAEFGTLADGATATSLGQLHAVWSVELTYTSDVECDIVTVVDPVDQVGPARTGGDDQGGGNN